MYNVVKELHCITALVFFVANGSIRWQAPEVIGGAEPGFSSDIYSFGMTMLECVSGAHPYSRYKNENMVKELVRKNETPARPMGWWVDLNDEWWKAMKMCWLPTEDRPSIAQLTEELAKCPHVSE